MKTALQDVQFPIQFVVDFTLPGVIHNQFSLTDRKTDNTMMSRRRSLHAHALTSEVLESRILLAGDSVSAWQNQVDHLDVSGDGDRSSIDLLLLFRELNLTGAHRLGERAAAEPGSEPSAFLDVNGDGMITSSDAIPVVRALNLPEGEGEVMQFRLEVTDTDGNPITQATVGEQIQLRGYIQDLRDATEATGLFSAYADVQYDASLVNVATSGAISFGDEFPNGTSGNTSIAGLVDEVGAFINAFEGFGVEESLLFTVSMGTTAAGTVTFSTNGADITPAHDTSFFLPNEPIPEDDILFGTVDLEIVAPSPPDLLDFALSLDTADIQFWSTRQFNTDAVIQRGLFEDGADALPFLEALDSEGNLNASAIAAGVTAVNTWVFPNQVVSDGSVLSLEEISTMSGVPIPRSDGPSLKGLPDITVLTESPLHISLDGYDPSDDALRYSFTVEDPSVLDVQQLVDNRSWSLDVEGYGPLTLELFEGRAPRATGRIIELTQTGIYDGLSFHRVIDGFMIQGGDPAGDGTGGSMLDDFDDDFHVDLQHNRRGTASFAKSGDDTNNSQFFITETPRQHLDFQHSVFGVVTEHDITRESISNVPTDAFDVPLTPVTITSAEIFDDKENGVLVLKALADSGSTTVTVTATDSLGRTATQSFEVTLGPSDQNSEPFLAAIPDFSVPAGSSFEFQLEATDIEGDTVHYFANVPAGSDAVAQVSEDGRVIVTIPADFPADTTLRVQVTVSSLEAIRFASDPFDTQLVNVLVTPALPRLADDNFVIDEDSEDIQLDVLANDEVANAMIVSLSTLFLSGSADISADGQSVVYTPAPNFFGTESFDYTISSDGGERVGTVTVMVENVDDVPVANDDFYPADFATDDPLRDLLHEDTESQFILDVLSNDSNFPDPADQETFTITNVTGGDGTIVNNGNQLFYAPSPDFFGVDTFTYTITGDTTGETATATVTINVTEVNDPPEAGLDTPTVPPGQTTIIPASELLANDGPGARNEQDQTVRIISVRYDGDGVVELTEMGDIAYTPGSMNSDLFTYVAEDDGTTNGVADPRTSEAQVNVTIEFRVRNDVFDVGANSATTLDVLANDSVGDLLISDITTAANGVVAIVADGTRISYTPNFGFIGTDSFTYTVDDDGELLTATVEVQVANAPPTTMDDTFVTESGGTINVLGNDTPGAGSVAFSVVSVTQPSNGVSAIVAGGAGVQYTPNTGFTGPDSFTYTVRNQQELTAVGTVMVTVTGSEVVVINDMFDVDFESGPVELDVLANDSPNLTIVDIGVPINGTAEITQDGTRVTYTPNNNFAGNDSFTYTVDDNGSLLTATVRITVDTEGPTAVTDTFMTELGGVINVLGNDIIGIGAFALSVRSVTQPTNGVSSIVANGAGVNYVPNAGFTGNDSFTYTVIDENDKTATGTVNVTVGGDVTNLDPIAFDDDVEVFSNSINAELDVLANDTDLPDQGETLTIAAITLNPANGTAAINANGDRILYTPNTDFVGSDRLSYRINDGNGGSATATVEISVVGQNVPPTANDDSFSATTTAVQVLDVLANDTREAGETLRIVAVQAANIDGTVEISGNGSRLLYTPPSNFFGTDEFTYTIDDGTGLTSTGRVSVGISTLIENSFFSGFVFMDDNDNGRREGAERGIANVTVVLEGTDAVGNAVRQETRSDFSGAYRFDGLAPGQYSITERQPAWTVDGKDVLAKQVTNGDVFEITVSNGLITSEGNLFGERGLDVSLASLDALASNRDYGLLVVLDAMGDLAWLQEQRRGGWNDIGTVDVSMEGGRVTVVSTSTGGVETVNSLTLADRRVQMIGTTSDGHRILVLDGTRDEVMSSTAVDAIFAT